MGSPSACVLHAKHGALPPPHPGKWKREDGLLTITTKLMNKLLHGRVLPLYVKCYPEESFCLASSIVEMSDR